MQKVSFLLPDNIHSSWHLFLTDELVLLLNRIEKQLQDESAFTPSMDNILRFLMLDLSSVKALIIGQDPYPQIGVATGRAFEVGTLKSWHDTFRNTSLRNIVRALYAVDHPDDLLTFSDIKKEMKAERFQLLSPSLLFEHWEKQGVLLLNTSFSCRVGKPGSHAAMWAPFTNRLFWYIHSQQPDITWLLWGAHAVKSTAHLQLRHVLTSCHPMICYRRPDDFLFGEINPFRELREAIDWGFKSI
ncbi:uracil-DNA glycosylase [Geofilum sp. OHC36d9]|uniref:uracil-DNA glycosylase n=1 Tax=Geofilum sp. OHC36d9 TaxID=3458413 RepID=UPI004033AA64